MSETLFAYAPDGSRILGTTETLPGRSEVSYFTSGAPDYAFEHEGGTEIFYDGAKTLSIAGATMFLDENGEDWLEHHLILIDEDDEESPAPLSDETIALCIEELRLGNAYEAAREYLGRVETLLKDDQLKSIGQSIHDDALKLERFLKKQVLAWRDRVKDAIAAELKAAERGRHRSEPA